VPFWASLAFTFEEFWTIDLLLKRRADIKRPALIGLNLGLNLGLNFLQDNETKLYTS
jgi:hypothetical protein